MADRYAPSHETLQILKSTKLAPETFLGYQNMNEEISCCIFSPIHKKVPLMSCEGLLLSAGQTGWKRELLCRGGRFVSHRQTPAVRAVMANCRVLLTGDRGVGKTSLIKQFLAEDFQHVSKEVMTRNTSQDTTYRRD